MKKRQKIKDTLIRYRKQAGVFLKIYNYLNIKNRLILPASNAFISHAVLLNGFRIFITRKSKNNTVMISDFSRLKNCSVYIDGNDNTVTIGEFCCLNGAEFYIEDSGNNITIGNHTSIDGKTHFAAIESTDIRVGDDCMFSADIQIRSGDSHVILDQAGKRINPSQSVVIGNHVWICNRAVVLKGTVIGDNSVVANSAVVRGCFNDSGSILAGVPAKAIKTGINWKRER